MLKVLLLSLAISTQQADTLHVTLEEAEKQFLQKNLIALAQSYQVEATKALEIQARLYPNPILNAEINAYDGQHKEAFHVDQSGQKLLGIQQLILLGGKRRTGMEISRQNSMIANLEFEDLLRNLKLQLHTNFFQVHFNQRTVVKFDYQLSLLDSIIYSYELQAKKGNIPYKEVIRLKSVYIRLNNDKTEFVKQILEQQKELQILLQTSEYVSPIFTAGDFARYQVSHQLDSLTTMALKRRPDYKASQAAINNANLNLKFQKALAVPDVILGTAYDQRGGAFVNQVGLSLSMPLPITNRNQGMVKNAEQNVKITDLENQQLQKEITAQVSSAWQAYATSLQAYQKVQQVYNEDFVTVFNGVSDNFRRRNITLIEFVDFFESYNDTLVELAVVEKQLALSAVQLNFCTASTLY